MLSIGKYQSFLPRPNLNGEQIKISEMGCCSQNPLRNFHYSDFTMGAMASQMTGVSIFCSTVCSGEHQRKHQKLRVTGLWKANPPVTGGLPSQRASNAEMFPSNNVTMAHKGGKADYKWLLSRTLCVGNPYH